MKNESENTRLERLLSMHQSQPNDVFLNYALALEWQKNGDKAAAIEAFEKTLSLQADYLAAYYQLGQLYHESNQLEKAISCFEKGISAAQKSNDLKALAELKNALMNAQIGD